MRLPPVTLRSGLLCKMARPSVRTLLPDLQGTLTARTISDLPGLSILRLTGKPPHQVRPAVIFFPVIYLTNLHIHKCISKVIRFLRFSAFPSLASSSSSSPSELSEGPASDGSSQALATTGSNQQDGSGVAAASGAAAGSTQAAGPKSGPASSVPVAPPAPRLAPVNNGPLPQG